MLRGFELHLSLSGVINILFQSAQQLFLSELLYRDSKVFCRIPPGEELEDVWLMTEWGAGGHLPQLCGATAPWWEPRRISKHTFGCGGLGRISAGAQTNCPAALFVLAVTWGCDFISQLYGDQNGEYSWVFFECSGQDVRSAMWLLISQRSKAGIPVSTWSMARRGAEGHGGDGLTAELDDLRDVFHP